MQPTGHPSRYYAFGPFVLDGLRGILWQYGAPVPLTPKVIQMLVALVSRAGDLLPKDELIREGWGDTVVAENNLAAFATAAAWITGPRDRTASLDVAPTQRSLRQLSYGSGLQHDPAWSADGLRIAYAADHSGNADLRVQTIGESEPVRLTSSPRSVSVRNVWIKKHQEISGMSPPRRRHRVGCRNDQGRRIRFVGRRRGVGGGP